jgi:hypothetical protein
VVAPWRAEDFVFIRKEKIIGLYRGKNYGVFTGPNDYYMARILGVWKEFARPILIAAWNSALAIQQNR